MAELRQLWQKQGTSAADCSRIRRNAVITRNALLGKNVEDFLKIMIKGIFFGQNLMKKAI
mgnify:CR=1 FL=1